MPSHPIDVHVGTRMRQRRTLLGMSQTGIGDAVGLTFQQIQKYERGSNRISSSRLFEFAKVLDVPVSYFFEEMSAKTRSARPLKIGQKAVGTSERLVDADPLLKRETLQLVRAFYKIRVPKIRNSVAMLIKAIAADVLRPLPTRNVRRKTAAHQRSLST